MTEDKCPFCEANVSIRNTAGCVYSCGTSKRLSSIARSDNCKDRQITQLTERLEAWRDYPRYKHDTAGSWETALRTLKDLGEIK